MTKFPFTPQGFAKAQDVLYQLSDDDLRREAFAAAGDLLSWAASRFEPELHLLEDLRNLPEVFRLQLGWWLAAALLERSPLSFIDHGAAEGTKQGITNLSFGMAFAAAAGSSHELKGDEDRFVSTLGTTI